MKSGQLKILTTMKFIRSFLTRLVGLLKNLNFVLQDGVLSIFVISLSVGFGFKRAFGTQAESYYPAYVIFQCSCS